MPLDALDPGPDNDYPNWPRDADGVPRGVRPEPDKRRPSTSPAGETLDKIDPRPRTPSGQLIVPPTIPPG